MSLISWLAFIFSTEALAIKACDKLHSMRSLVRDLEERDHNDVWRSFSGGREGTLSVAHRLSEALRDRVPDALSDELMATIRLVDELAG